MSDNQPRITLALLDQWERIYPGDILRGYLDGTCGRPWPDIEVSPAYEHGRRNGVNDRAGIADDEQRHLARELREAGRL